ncbi:hypothetical protein T492DRAFT_1098912 [Pavlovales sp. CCMP2436]|nr:hypothetical protein T492DRAFT_1098912 [Pavlovales sp. CCMP2436]
MLASAQLHGLRAATPPPAPVGGLGGGVGALSTSSGLGMASACGCGGSSASLWAPSSAPGAAPLSTHTLPPPDPISPHSRPQLHAPGACGSALWGGGTLTSATVDQNATLSGHSGMEQMADVGMDDEDDDLDGLMDDVLLAFGDAESQDLDGL